MAKTTWSGGQTSIESMGANMTNLLYTEVRNEIPIIRITGGGENTNGYYDGASSGSTHTIPNGSNVGIRKILKCTINGKEVDAAIGNEFNGTFQITSTIVGFVKLTYLPKIDAIYFNQDGIASINTPFITRNVSFNKVMIGEILYALNKICDEIPVPRRKYSISQNIANPIEYTTNDSSGILSNVPITKKLWLEIMTHVEYLNAYVINSAEISADLLQTIFPSYTSKFININIVSLIRQEINSIEGTLE